MPKQKAYPITESQCSVFIFGDNYHTKVLNDDSYIDLSTYFSFDQAKKERYDELAWQLICLRLIVKNSLSMKTCTYLKEQYVVNQSNYPNTMVDPVAMITSFGNGGGDGGNRKYE